MYSNKLSLTVDRKRILKRMTSESECLAEDIMELENTEESITTIKDLILSLEAKNSQCHRRSCLPCLCTRSRGVPVSIGDGFLFFYFFYFLNSLWNVVGCHLPLYSCACVVSVPSFAFDLYGIFD